MKQQTHRRHIRIARKWRTHFQQPSSNSEHLWFSQLPVPERFKRLRTGEPIPRDLYEMVVQGLREALLELPLGWPLKAKWFVGPHVWDDLSRGDRIRAGRCLADIARHHASPIGLVRRPGRSHRYFVRPAQGADTSSTAKA
jgi:hypothetical protein